MKTTGNPGTKFVSYQTDIEYNVRLPMCPSYSAKNRTGLKPL